MNSQTKRDLENNTIRLVELQEQIRLLKSQESIIKDYIKKTLPIGAHCIGDVIVAVEVGTRSNLSKKDLIENLGAKFIERFTSYTDYMKVSIKKISIKTAS